MVTKARLVEIRSFAQASNRQSDPVSESEGGVDLALDFNPENLKVSVANNSQGGNQPGGGSGKQYIGTGTSSLSIECVFDTSDDGTDVRVKTEKVGHFVAATEQPGDPNNRRTPPRCRFEWGSFIFEGIVDSMDETLEYFTEDGVPLRATVSLKLSRDDIAFLPDLAAGDPATAGGRAGQTPLETARSDDSVESVAARAGRGRDWKSIAAANDIDDPLRMEAGAMLDLNAGASAGAGLSLGGGVSGGIGAGTSAGFGARAGFSAGLGGGAGFSAGAGASAGLSAGAGVSGGVGLGASAGASAGVGLGASAGFGASAGAGIAAGAGASAGFGGGASAGFGASAGAGASVGVGVKAGVGVNAGGGASASFGF